MMDEKILTFLKDAIKKGYSEDYLKQGLLAQGWPEQEVTETINQVKKELSQPIITEQKKPEEKPSERPQPVIIQEKPKKEHGVSSKNIFVYSISFIGVVLIIFLTLSVYSYIDGIKRYTVTDPQTGNPVTGHCLQSDPECKLMKAFAIDEVKKSVLTNALIAVIASLVVIIVYIFIPFKKAFVWSINILYLITIIIIYVIWLRFARTSSLP